MIKKNLKHHYLNARGNNDTHKNIKLLQNLIILLKSNHITSENFTSSLLITSLNSLLILCAAMFAMMV